MYSNFVLCLDVGLEFSRCLLAKEIVDGETGTPSPATGVTQSQWTDSWAVQDYGLVWLLEPERSPVVQRWSGTMEHPKQTGSKLGATVTAFAHHAYICSLRTLVFADLQSASRY